MKIPKISVVVPVHNSAEYLEQCLESIVNQTFTDIEIICIDDGSTDDSFPILQKFKSKDERIFLIQRETASGSAGLPRNIGLEHAKGKYIMFLDSDDYFDVTMLEKLYLQAEKTAAELVMCDTYRVMSAGEILEEDTELHKEYLLNREVFSYRDMPDKIFQISNAAVWHKLILRELLIREKIKFQLNTPILDDILFVNLLLVCAESISVIPDRLIYYRVLRQDAQTTAISRHKDSIYKSFKALNEELIARGLYEKVKKSVQRWTVTMMAWWHSSISDVASYAEVYELYKKEYFSKLNLLDIEPKDLENEGLISFYKSIVYENYKIPKQVLLEFTLVPGSNLIIYGAGKMGESLYKLIKEHGKHNIALWCDKNAEKMNNPLVVHPENITGCDYDAVLISIASEKIVEDVKIYLSEMGVEKKKIYWI